MVKGEQDDILMYPERCALAMETDFWGVLLCRLHLPRGTPEG